MRYRNKKTGAIIESASALAGVWEPADAPSTPDHKKEEPPTKEEPKKEVPKKVEDLTKKEMMKELDALGVEYTPKMTKAELEELMTKKRW